MNTMGQKMKAARRKKKITQAKMAQHLNIHRTTYTKYECGKANLPISSLLKVATLLDMSVEELLRE